jgi:hypothetical protein
MTRPMRPSFAALVLLAAPLAAPLAQQTRAERSKFTETSTHADVVAFVDSLQARGAKIRVGRIGKTAQGKDLPYVIASRPLVATPLEAKRLGRPIVYIQGNIHGGEIEGKEALQAVLRDLVMDPKPNALDSLVLIAVPNYNADGNDTFGPQAQQRGAQNGPEQVGQRTNQSGCASAGGCDLNRDYIKAEANETRASLAMFNAWDPDMFVDLHTTDGSFHGYALTYSPSLHPAAGIAGGTFGGAFVRDSMLPVIRNRMRSKWKYEVFDYGNFEGEPRAWASYEHLPRYGTNYYGLRGRLSILSEAYSHDPMERRVKSTEAFIREILSLTAQKSRAVLALTRGSDAALMAGTVKSVPIRSEMTKNAVMLPVIEEPLDTMPEAKEQLRQQAAAGRGGRGGGGGRGAACAWPLSEPGVRCGFKRSGRFITTRMPVKVTFDPVLSATVPVAYAFPKHDKIDSVLHRLRLHGVQVEEAKALWIESGLQKFMIDSVVKRPQPFQGHAEVRLVGSWQDEARKMYIEGADNTVYIVRTAQPLGVLAMTLLEPQSDDGLVTWNFWDSYVDAVPKTGATVPFPVFRLTKPIAFPTRIIQ